MEEKERVRRIVSDLGVVVSSSNPEKYFKRIAENLAHFTSNETSYRIFSAYAWAFATIHDEKHFPVFKEKYRQLISRI